MSSQRASTVSIKSLASAVARAVERESGRKGLEEQFTIDHNLIMGRWLREAVSLEEAEKIATDITKQVQQHAVAEHEALSAIREPFSPAVMILRGRIICGFIWDQRVILAE